MTALSATSAAVATAATRRASSAPTNARSSAKSTRIASIVILGGGPIGLVCALLLARQGFSSQLVDARPLEALQRDRRLLALSRGTLQVLESLLGPSFVPMAPIERVHVSSCGDWGATHLGAQDFSGVVLGVTVWYADLVAALARAVAQQARIVVQRPRRAIEIRQSIDHIGVALDDGSLLQGSLAIDAEGSPPHLRQARHCALLADLDFARPWPTGDAIERFTRDGPLALLPLPAQVSAAGHLVERTEPNTRVSMIWCLPAPLAQTRKDMAQDELLECIGRTLGPRIGAPKAIGERSMFALHTHRLGRICEHRLVHLGNAAQSLHPVAGQGFNLGIRDCVSLVESLVDTRALEGDDTLSALQRYGARRRLDRLIVPSLTNALPRIFSSSAPPIVLARSTVLTALDLVPGLRRGFARLLMFGAPR
jgi:2-octaprenyl-6-methoxyphenol hydroxylase